MVRSLIKNISPVSWFLLPWSWAVLWNDHCLPRYCTERKDPVEQLINLQQAVSVRWCNFFDSKVAHLPPQPLSARARLVLQKLSFSRLFAAAGLWYWQSPGMKPRDQVCVPLLQLFGSEKTAPVSTMPLWWDGRVRTNKVPWILDRLGQRWRGCMGSLTLSEPAGL